MKKRTEFLAISLVLTGSAIAATLTSDYGSEPAPIQTVTESPAVVAAPPEPERRGNPVVYDMDIPAEVMSDYEAASQPTADPLPTEDQVATDRRNETDTPIA